MAVYEQLTVGELEVDVITGQGMSPYTYGKKIFLDPVHGSDGNRGNKPKAAVKTYLKAASLVDNNKGDIIYYMPSTSGITLSAANYWSTTGLVGGTTLNYTKFIGTGSGTWYGSRSRIFCSASVTCSPMFTVAGIGNYFCDVYWSMDQALADNHNVVTVSGTYNRFDRCNFAGPLDGGQQGADTAWRSLIVTGGANTFVNCVIGLDTAAMTGAGTACLGFGASNKNHPFNIFENCLFLMQANGKNSFFINDEGTTGQGSGSLFRHCSFVNVRGQATTLTYALSWAEAGGGLAHVFDQCTFFGVDDIIATGNVSRAQFVQYGETNAKIGLMVNPSVT